LATAGRTKSGQPLVGGVASKIGSLCIMVCRSSSADAQESGTADRVMR